MAKPPLTEKRSRKRGERQEGGQRRVRQGKERERWRGRKEMGGGGQEGDGGEEMD